jgi:hypothetical protein
MAKTAALSHKKTLNEPDKVVVSDLIGKFFPLKQGFVGST